MGEREAAAANRADPRDDAECCAKTTEPHAVPNTPGTGAWRPPPWPPSPLLIQVLTIARPKAGRNGAAALMVNAGLTMVVDHGFGAARTGRRLYDRQMRSLCRLVVISHQHVGIDREAKSTVSQVL